MGPWGRKHISVHCVEDSWSFQLCPVQLLLSLKQCHFWNHSYYAHHRQLLLVWSNVIVPIMRSDYFRVCSNVISEIESIQRSTSVFAVGQLLLRYFPQQHPTHQLCFVLNLKMTATLGETFEDSRIGGLDSAWLWKWHRAVKFYDTSHSDICAKSFELYFTISLRQKYFKRLRYIFSRH